MHKVWLHTAAGLSALALSGCGMLEEEVMQAVQQASVLQSTCLDLPATPEDLRAEHRQLVSEMLEAWLGISHPEAGKSIRGKVKELRDAFSDAYANGDPELRKQLKPVQQDIDEIETRVKSIRTNIKTVVNGVRNFGRQDLPVQDNRNRTLTVSGQPGIQMQAVLLSGEELRGINAAWRTMGDGKAPSVTPQSYLYAANFLSAMLTATEEIQADVQALRVLAVKLKDDLEALGAKAPAALKPQIDELIKAVKNSVDFISAMLKEKLDQKKLADIEAAMQRIIWREVGFRAVDLLHRTARSVEPKLDQIDEKAWFILTLLSIVVYPSLSDQMAEEIERQFRNWSGSGSDNAADLLYGLASGSCRRLTASADAALTDSIRADSLIRPVYTAFVTAFSCTGEQNAEAKRCLQSIGDKPAQNQQTGQQARYYSAQINASGGMGSSISPAAMAVKNVTANYNISATGAIKAASEPVFTQ